MQKVLGSMRKVRFTQSTLHQASNREKEEPSLGKRQVKLPHQRSPYAMKFEDRSHEETARQQRCARDKSWNLAKNMYKLKEKDKTTFYSPAEKWVMSVTSIKEPEGRKFVVDSGASMHMVCKRDLNSAELETMRILRSPTTVMTANGQVLTREEATENVKELDLFVKVLLLEETPAVLSLSKLFAIYQTMYHSLSLVYLRIFPRHLHLLLQHHHRRILYLTSADTPKFAQPKEVEVRVRSYGKTRWMNPQKPKTKIKMVNQKKYKEKNRMNCLVGYRNSQRIWLMKVLQQSLGETQSNEVKTLPSHLLIFQWSREQKWNRVRVSTLYIRTFRRTQIVICA